MSRDRGARLALGPSDARRERVGRNLSSAAVAVVVLTPLAYLKRTTAVALASRALKGDSTLSAVGAAAALFALLGLLLYRSLGWWWADRVAAIGIACIATAEAYTSFGPGAPIHEWPPASGGCFRTRFRDPGARVARPLPTWAQTEQVFDAGEGLERRLSCVDVFVGRMRRA